MRNGIYRIDFKTPYSVPFPGWLVVKDGSVNGADSAFTFKGTYRNEVNKVTGDIHVKLYNTTAEQSVLGPKEFDLKVGGDFAPNGFNLTGTLMGSPGGPIEIVGYWLDEVA